MLDKIHASWSRGFIIYFYFAAERNLKYLDSVNIETFFSLLLIILKVNNKYLFPLSLFTKRYNFKQKGPRKMTKDVTFLLSF